jgi:ATP/maltotriose-dependent transcriptional regulator MalT
MKFLKNTLLFALAATLALAAFPLTSVSAAGQRDPVTPPPNPTLNERLEKVWAWQLRFYDRFGRAGVLIDKAQRLADRAKANGRDVSAVQAALDAFAAATKDAHPIYESMKGIVNSHPGFDENGKVTGPAQARETVQAMRGKIQEIKTIMNGTGRALREAIRAFREVDPQPQPTNPPPGA